MAFQAGINPPGGVWQEDTTNNTTCTKPYMCRAGSAVFKNTDGFYYFYSCNTWALIAAVCVIILPFGGFSFKNICGTCLMTFFMCVMLSNIVMAYIYSTDLVVAQKRAITLWPALVWLVVLKIVVTINSARIWHWLIFDKFKALVKPESITDRWMFMGAVAFVVGTFATIWGGFNVEWRLVDYTQMPFTFFTLYLFVDLYGLGFVIVYAKLMSCTLFLVMLVVSRCNYGH